MTSRRSPCSNSRASRPPRIAPRSPRGGGRSRHGRAVPRGGGRAGCRVMPVGSVAWSPESHSCAPRSVLRYVAKQTYLDAVTKVKSDFRLDAWRPGAPRAPQDGAMLPSTLPAYVLRRSAVADRRAAAARAQGTAAAAGQQPARAASTRRSTTPANTGSCSPWSTTGWSASAGLPGRPGWSSCPTWPTRCRQPEEGGLLYRFHLRPGLRFADGSPVRPSDAAASFRRIFRIVGPTAGSFYARHRRRAGMPGRAARRLHRCRGSWSRMTRPVHARHPAAAARPGLPAEAGAAACQRAARIGAGPRRRHHAHRRHRPLPHRALRPGDRPALERNPAFRAWNADAQPAGIPTRSNTASAWRTRRR